MCARAPGYLYGKIIRKILSTHRRCCFNEISEAAVQMFVVDKRQQSKKNLTDCLIYTHMVHECFTYEKIFV